MYLQSQISKSLRVVLDVGRYYEGWDLLRAQREVLERGARLLLEKETLDEADLLALHAAEPVVGAEPAG